MSYDPDAIFASASSPGYDPDAIFAKASAEADKSFVDPNIDSGDLGMSEDDFAPKPQEESDIGIMGAFKGAFENLGMLLSMPYGVAGGVAEAVKDTVTEVGTLAAGMNPFSDVKLSDSTMFDRSPLESAQGVASQFGDDMAQHMYLPQSEESAVVRDTVADAIPREAMQIAEALPPSGVALSATRNGIRMADDLIGDGSGAAGAAVRARGERIEANRQTLSGASTGSKFMADEHIDMIESAPVEQKRLYSQIRDDSRSANNGAGDTDRSSWSVVGDQFANRAEVLGEVGESYLADMQKAKEKIASAEGFSSGGSGVVYTSTRKLRNEMQAMLEADYGVKFDANGVPDLTNTPFYSGTGKLKNAINAFFERTNKRGTGHAPVSDFEDLEKLKNYLQEMSYSQKVNGTANSKSNAAIQRLSGMVNGTLRTISPEYAAANDGLSSVISSMNDLSRATRTDLSLSDASFSTGEWRKVAQNTRRLTSNTDSGINMDQTLKDIDEVLLNESGKGANGNISPEQLKRLGFTPNSDGGFDQQVNLRQLALFANYMDILNGDGKPTAFKNLIAEANDRHFENLAANSIWGNQVGASAAAVKGLQQKFRTEASQMRKAGEVVEKTDKLRANIKSQVDEAIAEMLGREYQ
jgi:hypothetical protein